MIGLLQRVSSANVEVGGRMVARIGPGLLVFVGVEKNDGKPQARRLLERIANYRVFSDEDGRMNLNLTDIGGELLLVPQFTLAADTRKGTRASFTPAASPEQGKNLFEYLLRQAQNKLPSVSCGIFGACMKVSLTNEGPVTFWLRAAPNSHSDRDAPNAATPARGAPE